MSKLDELGGIEAAKAALVTDYGPAWSLYKAIIERVEELERQLQSARELAETIVRYDDQCEPGATYHISEAVDWDGVVAAAREFLKLLEGK